MNDNPNNEKFLVPTAVLKEYFNVDNIVGVVDHGNGHINHTFRVIFPTCEYIIQRINNDVFDNPFAVMQNLELVTNYIRKNLIYEGKDPRTCTLSTIETRYGQNMAIVDDNYWRCMRFINEGETFEKTTDLGIFEEAGKAVGDFQRLLEGFHTRILVDTIPHFHDTPYRYHHFLDIIKIDRNDRVKGCQEEIKYINSRKDKLGTIVELLNQHLIPRRVTHNDTKLNNIMFSKTTGKALGLIDLDTVMKGSLLYDYGDALRIGASTAAEDERDLDTVSVDLELFKAFTCGYLSVSKGIITPEELKHLVDGFFLMTFEVGMRFLTDYIDGDNYFKLKDDDKKNRPMLNLERARCQLKLAREVENQTEKLKQIINDILIKQGYGIQI